MHTRFILAWPAALLLCAGCATSGGAAGGSTGTPAPAAAVPTADAAPAAAPAAAANAAPGTAAAAAPAAAANAAASATSAASSAVATSPARAGGSADPGLPARTPAEQRAAIDSRLNASLARFDDRLRKEQQQSASQRDAQATSGTAAGSGGDPQVTPGAESARDRDEIHRDRSGDLQSVGVQQDAGAQQGNAANGASANPIPSGADDDIIARRLRRAAENETDPELKAKLWKEYRDYKENTKGST